MWIISSEEATSPTDTRSPLPIDPHALLHPLVCVAAPKWSHSQSKRKRPKRKGNDELQSLVIDLKATHPFENASHAQPAQLMELMSHVSISDDAPAVISPHAFETIVKAPETSASFCALPYDILNKISNRLPPSSFISVISLHKAFYTACRNHLEYIHTLEVQLNNDGHSIATAVEKLGRILPRGVVVRKLRLRGLTTRSDLKALFETDDPAAKTTLQNLVELSIEVEIAEAGSFRVVSMNGWIFAMPSSSDFIFP